VAIEGKVTHSRLRSMCADHRHDLTLALSSLVKDGFLGSAGATRGKYYFFPGEPPLPSKSQLPVRSEHLASSSEPLEEKSSEHWHQLLEVGSAVRSSGKAPKEEIEAVILAVCQGCYLTLRELSRILGRSENTIRQNYLSGMTRDGRIILRYPKSPHHPNQAYSAPRE
jgi:ATP-dependent DNA helicase RecG